MEKDYKKKAKTQAKEEKETNSKTILLVDDEEGIRKVLSISLTDSGYKVITADNGNDAFQIFNEQNPPIVLTDIKMPGMTGIELLGKIKKINSETEVIMISGHGDMELAIESLKNDATDFVTKPINDDNLEIALRRANDRILMRKQLRQYTENLEVLVKERSAQLVKAERASQQRYQNLFDVVPCYITVQDRDFKLTAMNHLFKQDFDPTLDSFCYQVYKNLDAPCTDCPVAKTFEDGKSHQSEMIVTSKTGETINLLISTAPIMNNAGEISQVMELATNITQIRQLEDHLSAIGLKIGTIAHGIKGVLTGLDGGVYILDSGFTKDNVDKMKEGWDIVKLMVGRIRSLALDILYYAKERDLNWERVDVIRFAQGVASAIEPKMKSHQIKFVCDFDPAIGGIEIDTSVVRTALINIFENAIDACVAKKTDDPKIISFDMKKDKNHIVFDVIDNGIGMDEETRKNIFTLFYSSKGIEGTGLGLFISENIIHQHGGTINVTSQKDKGAHFCIRLPDTAANPEEKKK